jgi:deazaflavin-dependent oxidoreductase (nitroreductase family)
VDRFGQFVYRISDGRIGEIQGDSRVLVLSTVGRKTGKARAHCLIYVRDGENCLVMASNFGLPQHPAWYYNLVANPRVSVQVGRKRFEVMARIATPDERSRMWPMIVETHPRYGDYQAATTREIPVVILSPTGRE